MKNGSLCKELSKSLHGSFYVVEDDFENAFQQVEHSYSIGLISQTQVHLNQMIVDNHLVLLYK